MHRRANVHCEHKLRTASAAGSTDAAKLRQRPQDQEQEPVLVALAMEDNGGESYGRCSETDSEIRAAESVKINSAGSSTTVLMDEQSYREFRHMPKGQQSALESPRMESEPRGHQGRKS
ncbi:hypothetical protein NDU88_004333 [Pleurodeles waltl]|uniref:Uncharacterized protein n=1 Tax=Pleurodeles waltl TaxID=8319 RepID=A0AAV7LHR2_PLEWA|nr:hypothetical protein NDU88_004333 [Pleurodeles waltl]